MHELSLCHEIAGVVKTHAAGRPVDVVRVRVGSLRQVVAESLTFCWGIVREHEDLGDAELELELVPAAVGCHTCHAQSEITSRWSICCPACSSVDVSVLRGEEFRVMSIDVAAEASHG
ncbi:MAG: hydrogenase maturation nickel metallochaperone HypA [Actinomycetia bacterium]|nr:hydrogenase maturation nickel metallochaperone HypA [Actinomycetes bacterium]